ncbi:hypothetical protein NIES4103_09270 [Nostoc sp. NIES-4103]|nr:hypothetical protein NIES4103_09270 [Nostoc sp. NIES-4103]
MIYVEVGNWELGIGEPARPRGGSSPNPKGGPKPPIPTPFRSWGPRVPHERLALARALATQERHPKGNWILLLVITSHPSPITRQTDYIVSN